MRILLAEDEAGAVIVMQRLLGPKATALDAVESLAGVWNALEKSHYDVVILDLKLTDSERETSLAAINEIKRKAKARLIVVSASLEPDIKERSEAAGADAFIYKASMESGTALLAAISAVVILDKQENTTMGAVEQVKVLERLVGKEPAK